MSRILLIEDNPDQAFVASRFLERAGFAVAHELTGAAGLEAARVGNFDLVMLDYQLPDTDGLTLLEKLLPFGAPVVLVTGRTEAQLAVKALHAGAANYIVKDSHYLAKLPDIARDTLERVQAQTHDLIPPKLELDENETFERFRQVVRGALAPLVSVFHERVNSQPFGDAVEELERVLSSAEMVLDEELEVLDQLLYEAMSKVLANAQAQA
jgi:DNA-binding response OmpR family regulator